ncbi:hypothetical protein [Vibrio sp. 11986-1-5]|uniref:hypothetical protein n=1 Tax=Vibrio sp. 11986-1-5 TaxID=2211215 RepID=UPI000D73A478|nr:hypothetical protein [Vibrio sp. 11986-1-5]PXA71070.1 hypothetical protein DMC15_12745 [Vibrio sp. 11986-1-5]
MDYLRRPRYRLLALLLISWVMALCLAKNSGVLSFCPEASSVFAELVSTDDNDTLSEPCHLTEKLLSYHLQQVVELFSPLLWLTVAIIVSQRLISRLPVAIFYEPRVPKRRPHLQLCVFHE